jgi:hypothetical protein
MGALAPALVTDISETVSALGIGMLMVRTVGFVPSLGVPARIAVSAGAAGAALFVTRPLGLIPAAVAGIAVYGAALLLTRALTPADATTLLGREMPA